MDGRWGGRGDREKRERRGEKRRRVLEGEKDRGRRRLANSRPKADRRPGFSLPFSETSKEDFPHPRLISLSSPIDISSVFFFSSLSSYQKETCSIPIPASQEVRPRKQTPALLSPSPVDSSSPSPFLLLLVDPYPLSKYKPRLG